MADIFDVIADATRRELLQVLRERSVAPEPSTGDVSVGELVELLGISQPTVSKHLRVLRDSGLVSVREAGQHRFYGLDTAPLEALEDWLIPFMVDVFDPSGAAGPTRGGARWSGARLPESLRRAGESFNQHGATGANFGRAMADARYNARHALDEASETVERRVFEPLKKKLKRDDD